MLKRKNILAHNITTNHIILKPYPLYVKDKEEQNCHVVMPIVCLLP